MTLRRTIPPTPPLEVLAWAVAHPLEAAVSANVELASCLEERGAPRPVVQLVVLPSAVVFGLGLAWEFATA